MNMVLFINHCAVNSFVDKERQYYQGIEILGEEVIRSSPSGTFLTVRRWLRGKYPKFGKLVYGYTGIETVIEMDIILPTKSIQVFLLHESVPVGGESVFLDDLALLPSAP